MTENIHIFIEKLSKSHRENPGELINMSQRCRWVRLYVVGHIDFGYDLNLQTEETCRFLVHSMMIGSSRVNMYTQFSLLRKLRLEVFSSILSAIRGRSFLRTTMKMIDSRMAEDKHAKYNLYSFMIDALGTKAERIRSPSGRFGLRPCSSFLPDWASLSEPTCSRGRATAWLLVGIIISCSGGCTRPGLINTLRPAPL